MAGATLGNGKDCARIRPAGARGSSGVTRSLIGLAAYLLPSTPTRSVSKHRGALAFPLFSSFPLQSAAAAAAALAFCQLRSLYCLADPQTSSSAWRVGERSLNLFQVISDRLPPLQAVLRFPPKQDLQAPRFKCCTSPPDEARAGSGPGCLP